MQTRLIGWRWLVALCAFHPLNPGAAQTARIDTTIRPFRIEVSGNVLDDLSRRLELARWPDQINGSGWNYGVDVAYMKSLVHHWRTKYDWRSHERRLNHLPQFITTIDGLDIHFVHVRSSHPQALPLVLVHGWPGSFVEFEKVISPLVDPVSHGGKPDNAFHVVIPSLPGFGFSSKPTEPGWNSQRMAEVIAKLMARLGYSKYGAQGGDWGGGIVRWLASADGDHCIGAHNNFPGGSKPATDPMQGVTQAELDLMTQRQAELKDHFAYSAIQGTRPLTLGFGLNDSPVGLAAWIVDKFWAWSDHGGNLDNSFSKDELLTNIMIYWITETMPSSTRIYFESSHQNPRPRSMTPFTPSKKRSPIGYVQFPKEINRSPRRWVERATGGSVVHWSDVSKGGHFAAMEQPQVLVKDVRKFFERVTQGTPK